MPTIKSLTDKIRDKGLLFEIGRRRLTKALVAEYLQQAYILPNRINAFAFRNDAGGHEIYYRNHEQHEEKRGRIGAVGIRVIPAGPKAEQVRAFVYTHFWDFLTRCHLYGQPKPDELHVITNGLTQNAADAVRKEPRTSGILFYGDGTAEHVFIEALNSEIETMVAGVEDLSDAYMENPLKVSKSLAAPERSYDLTQASSVTMQLRARPS